MQYHIFNVKQASSGKEKVAASFRGSALVLLYTTRAELSSFVLLPEPHSGIKPNEIQVFPVILV